MALKKKDRLGFTFQVIIFWMGCTQWVASTTPAPAPPVNIPGNLTGHYKILYEHYRDYNDKIKSDCKPKAKADGNDEHAWRERRGWGTLETLQFLSGELTEPKGKKATKESPAKLKSSTEGVITDAERRMDLEKLRVYMARIGYLKDPGSLHFLDKQTITLKLYGCPEGSVWWQQGERGNDDVSGSDRSFQKKDYRGKSIRVHTPNAYNYIHKFICVHAQSKCHHTFYVITKPLPDMPLGLQIRENQDSENFACGVPICNIQKCKSHNKEVDNRNYPPYKIMWYFPKELLEVAKANKSFNFVFDPVTELIEWKNTKNKAELDGVEIYWGLKVKKDKDEDKYENDPKPEHWKDAFGVDVRIPSLNTSSSPKIPEGAFFSSHLIIKGAKKRHSGLYECVIQDANGVVTTPNIPPEEEKHRHYEYHGDAQIHVMPFWQLWLPWIVSTIFCVLVTFIIFICPKKMEHDDGTPYTKDELVVPAAPAPSTSPSENQDLNKSEKHKPEKETNDKASVANKSKASVT